MELRRIKESPDYLVNECGQVYSLKTNKFLKLQLDGHGYYQINVSLGSREKRITKKVHRLVTFAFLGEPPEGKTDVNHIDGNPKNNHVSNLEWCNDSENLKHAHRLGLKKTVKLFGEDSGAAKITESEVRKIRELSNSLKIKEISILFSKISECQIRRIINRTSWSHI